VLDSTVQLLLPIVRARPKPFNERAAADVATELEWAKNSRVTPEAYVDAVNRDSHRPPLPAELMAGVYREYERRKAKAGQIGHEDQLELTIREFEASEAKLEEFRDRYRAFTVDEYQDVNMLQQTLLSLWLGERDDLCVVGDDYQSIYSFTGATPAHLLDMPRRFPGAVEIRLEKNYRSTPEILAFANRLVPYLGGAAKRLTATRPSGPKPLLRSFETNDDEAAFIAARVSELQARGVPLREMAVLYRVNFRSPLYEEALLEAGVPFQVREGAFLDRRAAKAIIPRLQRRDSETAVAQAVAAEARRAGYQEAPPPDLGAAELTRQKDMARLIALAGEFDDGDRRVADFPSHLRERFESESSRDAVQLMTYHSAKGLEFEAVFLPQVDEREIPYWRALEEDKVVEERRLFYVGLTRAKRELHVTWSRRRERSRFLNELLPPLPPRPRDATTGKKSKRWSGLNAAGRSSSRGDSGLSPDSWRPEWMREKDA
jgi:DNA helicase-2/ATP-dependent DNA helicase PcrA